MSSAATVLPTGHRHRWGPGYPDPNAAPDDDTNTSRTPFYAGQVPRWWYWCTGCHRCRDDVKSRRGRTTRSYGTRAELAVARTYGGTKVGHYGGPVDVLGTDWETQVKTHRRSPPSEWTKAFAALPGDKLPRILLRFVRPGLPPADYFVVPAKAWLDWHGKDE